MLHLAIGLAVLWAASEWLRRRNVRDQAEIDRAALADRDAIGTAVGVLRVPRHRDGRWER